MKHIAVIGGGITGVTTAYALARRGLQVTLLERHRYAAMETSFANGGQLSASNAEVWNHTSTVLKGLKWMLRSDAPLLVNPKPSWHKLSWFAQFIASISKYEHNTVQTARLAIAARSHLFAWAQEEGIDFDLKKQGILHIYRSKAGFDHAARVTELLARGGLARRAVTPQEMRAIEPTLAGQYHGGFFTESDSTGDIHKFTVGLAAAAQRLGVQVRYDSQVQRLQADGERASVTVLREGGGGVEQLHFDGLVVCAAAISLPNWVIGSMSTRSRAIPSPSICSTRPARRRPRRSVCLTTRPSWSPVALGPTVSGWLAPRSSMATTATFGPTGCGRWSTGSISASRA